MNIDLNNPTSTTLQQEAKLLDSFLKFFPSNSFESSIACIQQEWGDSSMDRETILSLLSKYYDLDRLKASHASFHSGSSVASQEESSSVPASPSRTNVSGGIALFPMEDDEKTKKTKSSPVKRSTRSSVRALPATSSLTSPTNPTASSLRMSTRRKDRSEA